MRRVAGETCYALARSSARIAPIVQPMRRAGEVTTAAVLRFALSLARQPKSALVPQVHVVPSPSAKPECPAWANGDWAPWRLYSCSER